MWGIRMFGFWPAPLQGDRLCLVHLEGPRFLLGELAAWLLGTSHLTEGPHAGSLEAVTHRWQAAGAPQSPCVWCDPERPVVPLCSSCAARSCPPDPRRPFTRRLCWKSSCHLLGASLLASVSHNG